MRRYAVAVVVSLFVTSGAFAQAVQQMLASYGTPPRTGRVFLQRFGSAIDWSEGLVATKDAAGNYYLAGTADFGTFNPNNGLTSAAKFKWYVTRYDSTMRPDTTWGAGGVVTLDFGDNDMELTSIVIDANGKIVCGGIDWNVSPTKSYRVARFITDGTLDATFGNFGVSAPMTPAQAIYSPLCLVALQSTGKIVVMAQDHTDGSHAYVKLWRLRTNGAIDTSWGTNSTASFLQITGSSSREDTRPYCVAVDASDRVYVGGTTNASVSGGSHWFAFIARFTSTGANDSAWGTDVGFGFGLYGVLFDGPQALTCNITAILFEGGTGKPIAVGEANNDAAHTGVLVARFTTAGALDTTYGASSGFTINNFSLSGSEAIDSAAFDSAGRILAAGQTANSSGNYFTPTTRYAVFRFTAGGLVDTTYGTNGAVTPVPTGDNQLTAVYYGVGIYLVRNTDDSLVLPGHSNCNWATTGNCTGTLTKIKADGTVDTSVGDHVTPATMTAPTATTAAPSVGTTTATLNGTVTAAVNSSTCYQFEYGLTAGVYAYRSPNPCAATTSDASPHNVAASLSGLLSGYTYHYRVVATSRIGDATRTTYSADATFATTGGATNTIVSDSFTDANGALLADHTPDVNFTGGNFWFLASGTGSIQSNKFQATTDVIESINIGLTTGFTVSVSMTRVSATLTTEMDLYYRINDHDSGSVIGNRMWAQHKGTTFSLVERIGGSNVTKATATQTWLQGETHTIAVTVSGTTVTATFDGGNAISYNTMTSETWTAVGMEVEAATNTADNFVVTTP